MLRAIDRTDDGAGHEVVRAIGCHALRVTEVPARDLHEAFEAILERPENVIMSTAEKLQREGYARGRIAALARLLEQRFGPLPAPTTQRLADATIADLDRWTDRVLAAPSLDDVFAPQ